MEMFRLLMGMVSLQKRLPSMLTYRNGSSYIRPESKSCIILVWPRFSILAPASMAMMWPSPVFWYCFLSKPSTSGHQRLTMASLFM